MTSTPFALYIHVPFCAHKCPYCDFNTYATPQAPEGEYVAALIKELKRYSTDERFKGRAISSIFFGGGTPSLLSPKAIGEIIAEASRAFCIAPQAEVTLEANPSHPSKERYQGYREAGVNRISFGVQSFNQSRLTLLGRDHSVDDAERAVMLCTEAGISNVSVDIIFGVTDQSVSHLEADLAAAIALPIAHLSTYALTIERGTPFFQRQERGLLTLPPDETVAAMLDFIPTYLTAHGFKRYEISNYARGDFASRHNEAYWLGTDYIGIGAGAHSYVAAYQGERATGGSRWNTLALPASYMKAAGTTATTSWSEELSLDMMHFEFFYLGLRRAEGVSLLEFERRFGLSAHVKYGTALSDLEREGFLSCTEDRIALTSAGITLADSVYERLIP